jgi:uncharacterized membrane protein YqjE
MPESMPPPRPAASSGPDNPSTADVVRELARDAAGYGRDLVQLFAAELKQESRQLGRLGAMLVSGLVLLLFSFGLLTVALVGVVALALASWRWALLIVGVGYGLVALGLLLPAAGAARRGMLQFHHTRRRLREDSHWIKEKMAA